jgi:hypothetical protein
MRNAASLQQKAKVIDIFVTAQVQANLVPR